MHYQKVQSLSVCVLCVIKNPTSFANVRKLSYILKTCKNTLVIMFSLYKQKACFIFISFYRKLISLEIYISMSKVNFCAFKWFHACTLFLGKSNWLLCLLGNILVCVLICLCCWKGQQSWKQGNFQLALLL